MKNSMMAVAVVFAFAGCAHKAPPAASTTTTRTTTSTESSSGDAVKTDVTEKRIEHADGTQELQTTTKTDQVVPPTVTPAAIK